MQKNGEGHIKVLLLLNWDFCYFNILLPAIIIFLLRQNPYIHYASIYKHPA